ncbi:Kelch repeat-containing protein [Handroanthus impetiginosus]|uniref:Kelch repeat-containing protein n=1 Tax=Handroanthus impetiginosus TaxID=429701 RepID=A0A2G9I297_9LAMI|nr:Kelch repeat-containing protein [Handroanthus impetiginosus]
MSSEKEGGRKRKQSGIQSSQHKKTEPCPMAESSTTSSNNGSSPITRIPQDHLFSILLLLPVESILSFAMTCKKLKSLAYSDSLWESICKRDWGQTPVDSIKGSNHLQQLPWKRLYQQVYQLDSVFCRRLLVESPDGDGILPSPRASHSLNLVSGFLVLFGGGCEGGRHLDDTWIAYIGNNFRTTLKWQKINSGIPSGRFGHSCVVIGDSLVLFGGINDLGIRQNDTWIGQVTVHEKLGITFSWRLLDIGPIASSPPPRGAHAGCCIENKRMLIHGGIGLSGVRLGDTWVLNLSEDLYLGTWREITAQPSPPPRSGHSLTHIGGSQTILFGGRGTGFEVLNDVWILDASEGRWRWSQLLFEIRNVPQGFSLPRVGHSASLIIGRRLLIYGGEDSYRNRKDDFWVLDISSMSCLKMQGRSVNENRTYRRMWRKLESKGEKLNCRSFHGACVDDSGRYLYVYGGMVDGLVQPADPSGLRFDGESFLLELVMQS